MKEITSKVNFRHFKELNSKSLRKYCLWAWHILYCFVKGNKSPLNEMDVSEKQMIDKFMY